MVGRDPFEALLCRRSADRVAAGRVENNLVSMDEYAQHVALPKLYGAPAYARPAIAVAHTPRPLDPDDLPIVAQMTEDDIAVLARLPDPAGRVPGSPMVVASVAEASPAKHIGPRPFSIRALADRVRRPRS